MPSAAKVTVPWPAGGWVTDVTARRGFLKVSAVAPFVPVRTLKLIAVSSAVVTVSGVMSATALMVIATVSVSVSDPSEVTIVSVSEPL